MPLSIPVHGINLPGRPRKNPCWEQGVRRAILFYEEWLGEEALNESRQSNLPHATNATNNSTPASIEPNTGADFHGYVPAAQVMPRRNPAMPPWRQSSEKSGEKEAIFVP